MRGREWTSTTTVELTESTEVFLLFRWCRYSIVSVQCEGDGGCDSINGGNDLHLKRPFLDQKSIPIIFKLKDVGSWREVVGKLPFRFVLSLCLSFVSELKANT